MLRHSTAVAMLAFVFPIPAKCVLDSTLEGICATGAHGCSLASSDESTDEALLLQRSKWDAKAKKNIEEKAEAASKAKAEAEAKKAEEKAKAEAATKAKKKAEEQAKAKAAAKAKAEAEAKKAEEKTKAEAAAKAKAEAEAKKKTEGQSKTEAAAKAKAEAEAKKAQEKAEAEAATKAKAEHLKHGSNETHPTPSAACGVLTDLFPIKPTGESQMTGWVKKRDWQPGSDQGRDPPRFTPDAARVRADLYPKGTDPYEGLTALPPETLSTLDQYGSSARRQAGALSRKIVDWLGAAPKLIIEVGSFTGTSAAHTWAPMVAPGGVVLAIDTWEGDINMRMMPNFEPTMGLQHGFPTLGLLFMRRMVALGVSRTVLPLSLPSIVGARLMYLLGYEVDVVYVDSAHERGETLVELTLYWQLLKPGGVMLGDDYDLFPAVKHDVDFFVKCHGVPLDLSIPNQWILRKPPAA